MNYCKVNTVGVFGNQAADLEVECVQSRRLPFLQILGGSVSEAAAQRERVIAALESGGFRLPSRRITVSVLATGASTHSGASDLAVALAILGSIKAVPAAQLAELYALGGLSLDGRLQPLAYRVALRSWLERHPRVPLLLPWADSDMLGESPGGGFHALGDVVRFLRGGGAAGPRRSVEEAIAQEQGSEAWERLREAPLAKRVAQVCAAGGHPLLLTGVAPAVDPRALAMVALALLPAPQAALRDEMRAIRKACGEEGAGDGRWLREVKAAQASRVLRFDPRSGLWGDLSLAHGGLLFLPDFGERPALCVPKLQEPVETGAIRAFYHGRVTVQPADWLLVAHSALCGCGSGGGRCACPAGDVVRFRRRLAASLPLFSLYCHLAEVNASPESEDWQCARATVARVRAECALRQEGVNARLGCTRVFSVKAWEGDAERAWRSRGVRFPALATRLAGLALTLSDLRGGCRVERRDVMEAMHYMPGGLTVAEG